MQPSPTVWPRLYADSRWLGCTPMRSEDNNARGNGLVLPFEQVHMVNAGFVATAALPHLVINGSRRLDHFIRRMPFRQELAFRGGDQHHHFLARPGISVAASPGYIGGPSPPAPPAPPAPPPYVGASVVTPSPHAVLRGGHMLYETLVSGQQLLPRFMGQIQKPPGASSRTAARRSLHDVHEYLCANSKWTNLYVRCCVYSYYFPLIYSINNIILSSLL